MKKKKKKKSAAHSPIFAAGGIVTRGRSQPVFAVVRLRRQKSWVLPKGKLNRNESALAAAKREAIEETGHDMKVREFLGSLAYTTSGRPKTVRFWRMEASRRPVAKLMKDVSAVRWLPLARAVGKLTHEREKEFLAKVGPLALSQMRSERAVKPPRNVKTARADRPVRDRSNPLRASFGNACAAPREIMQSLWRWLGR